MGCPFMWTVFLSAGAGWLAVLLLISDDMVKKAVSTLMDSFALVSRKFIPNDSAKACIDHRYYSHLITIFRVIDEHQDEERNM
jgi:hypothetical protein